MPSSFSRRDWILAALILLLAAGLRGFGLDWKPPHFDEGVNGMFVDLMRSDGFYRYDPTNYHGPLFFYVLLAGETLFGRSIVALRLPTVLAGLGVVALALFGYRRVVGDRAARWFALWLAVSPTMVFVSRYAIHETFMLLFLMLAALGLAEFWSGRRGAWLICLGAAGMVLTKETYVIHFACFGLAWVLWRRLPAGPPAPAPVERARDFVTPALVGLGAILFFYSGTLLNPPGIAGLWRAFAAWAQTGEAGNGHQKAWYYWLELLGRYEWVAAAGFVASIRFLRPAPKGLRLLVIAGAGTLAAYSLVPYKTPWCLITIAWTAPLALAAVLEAVARRGRAWGVGAAVLGAALAAHDLAVAVRLNAFHYADPKEPLVYVQTLESFNRITDPLQHAVAADPRLLDRPLAIIATSPHPLPWQLGEFTSVLYYGKTTPLDESIRRADFVLTTSDRRGEVEAWLAGDYRTIAAYQRASGPLLIAYFRADVFGPWVDAGAAHRHFPPAVKPTP